jgi:sigma54-dependent transcription regulator
VKTVVIGMLGITLDAMRKGGDRWSQWRPTVDICRHEDLVVDRFELLFQPRFKTLAGQITAQIDESLSLAEALRPPFDQEIAEENTEGNARVEALAQALFDQKELIEQAFELYGLTRISDPPSE